MSLFVIGYLLHGRTNVIFLWSLRQGSPLLDDTFLYELFRALTEQTRDR
jgi:hypothetical protein